MPEETQELEETTLNEETDDAQEPETVTKAAVEEIKEEIPAKLTKDQVNDWLIENNYTALPANDPRLKKLMEASQEKEDEGDEDDLVSKKELKKIKAESVSEAEERMTRRYAALDAVTSTLDKYKDLPVEARKRIVSQFQRLPVEHIEAQIESGMIEREAKAELFDLMDKGVIESKAKKIPGAAPVGGEPKATGLRSRLTPEQLKELETNENLYTPGKKWDDAQIAEAFGLDYKVKN